MYSVYCYENTINGKLYIGLTQFARKIRAGNNFSNYRNCIAFFNALTKYGYINFNYWIIEMVDTKEQAEQSEKFWIEELRRILGHKFLYNIKNGGGGIDTHCLTTKQKISYSLKGRPKSTEHIAKMRHEQSSSTKHKISKAHKGRLLSEEHKKKISKSKKGIATGHAPMQGRKHTDKTKNKISMANSGIKHPLFNRCGANNPKYGKYKNLSNDQVNDISIDERSERQIARHYKINRSTVHKIKQRNKL